MSDKVYDVVVIGGGPAGLSCAIYTSRARLSTIVLDRSAGGGALAASTKIANYPGVKGPIEGDVLLDTMRRQALEFGAEYCKTTVVSADVLSDPKVVYASDGTYRGRALVIATGSLGRTDRIEGEEEFTGRGVSYCATCDAAFFEDRVAAVVGHDETAIEEALFLTRFAREVLMICPRTRLSGPVDLLDQIEAAPGVTVHLATRAQAIVGEQFVTGIVVKGRNGSERTIDVDGVFMLLSGTAPITDFLGGAVKLKPGGCIEVDCNGATNVPGVYAVGDVACIHPNQAIIAAAEGVIAALELDRFLSGRERSKTDYL